MNKDTLLEAMATIKPGIANDSLAEHSDLVLFKRNQLVSYNDEIAVSVPFKTNLTGGISAIELFKLLQRLEEKEIKIEQKKNQFLLTCGKTRAGFNIQEVSFPNLITNGDKTWKRLPKNFLDALSFCLFSASSDISRGILTCLKTEKNTMISCDNFRLTRYQLASRIAGTLLIPGDAVQALINHNPIKYSQDNTWLHFQNKNEATFSCRTIPGEFPDISNLFKVSGEEIKLPEELKQTLLRAEILSGDTDVERTVDITLSKGKIICKAKNSIGWVTEAIKTKYNGQTTSFAIDPRLLLQILDHAYEAIINDNRIRFDGESFTHVIALAR